MNAKTTLTTDQLPILPETRLIDPLVQCGVLYLGSAPPSPGLRTLESIQEPFSRRYPVDGTNTVRGIDAILSIYDHGVQLAFTRQPHSVVFFPISSLIYCASLRFSIIESDQSKLTTLVDWRFMPLDSIPNSDSKHPPLFCAVFRRTQISVGDECHCFITKSPDAAIALVRTISEVYATLQPGFVCLKSPIFYQLDRYGRKLSEITGVVYISPANEDNSKSNRLIDENTIRNYLLDPSYDGFFYRTDASLIEQWQLWDDDQDYGSRPRPPPSPFGLHEGLYHDDTTHEIQRYLRRMDEEDEKQSCSCHSSASQTSTTNSASTENSRKKHHHSNKQTSSDDPDQFDTSLSTLQTSSFEPILSRKYFSKTKKSPIIIEKVLPKPISSIPILNPKLPQQSNKTTYQIPYQINERGEKITQEGNRIVFMDVVQMNPNDNSNQRSRSHRPRSNKPIPMIDLQHLDRFYKEKLTSNQRRLSQNFDTKIKDNHQLSTPDQIEILEEYFEDSQGKKYHSNQATIQSLLNQQRKSSSGSTTTSSKNDKRQHRSHSTVTKVQPINYAERPALSSLIHSENSSKKQQHSSTPPVLTDARLNEYISNIYGISRSVPSISSNSNTTPHTSAFRYVQNGVNRGLLKEYRNAY